jgi:hypothetical protein
LAGQDESDEQSNGMDRGRRPCHQPPARDEEQTADVIELRQNLLDKGCKSLTPDVPKFPHAFARLNVRAGRDGIDGKSVAQGGHC